MHFVLEDHNFLIYFNKRYFICHNFSTDNTSARYKKICVLFAIKKCTLGVLNCSYFSLLTVMYLLNGTLHPKYVYQNIAVWEKCSVLIPPLPQEGTALLLHL